MQPLPAKNIPHQWHAWTDHSQSRLDSKFSRFKPNYFRTRLTWEPKVPADSLSIGQSCPVWLLHTHTHTRLTALCPGLPGWAGTRKAKPIWILLKQETVSGSGISWAICKSAPRSRQITTPAPHRSVFLQARMPFLPPNQQCLTPSLHWPQSVFENTYFSFFFRFQKTWLFTFFWNDISKSRKKVISKSLVLNTSPSSDHFAQWSL